MPDPTPIRGRWTIGPGGYFEGDPSDPSYVLWHVKGAALRHAVEVVPAPDEQAIDRGARAVHAGFEGWFSHVRPDDPIYEAVARAVLAAYLEQPDA